jgi:carboxypeptidase T
VQPLRAKLAAEKVPAGYSDLDAINAYLASVASQYPQIAQVLDSRQFSVGTTYEDRLMPLIKLSANVTADEDEPVFLMNAAHHAREIVTPHLALDAIRRLTSGYGTDAAITTLLNTRAVIVAPVWNPDGYVYMWDVNNLWRKNRKPSSDGRNYGVDQNRNYDIGTRSRIRGARAHRGHNDTHGTRYKPLFVSRQGDLCMDVWGACRVGR